MEHSHSAMAEVAQIAYMPHGHCYMWQPGLIGVHVVSDLLIGSAYILISATLYLILRRIKIPFSAMVLSFGIFIGACGISHFMEIWTLWYPDYWLSGGVKILTAIASLATSLWLLRLRPQIYTVAAAAKLAEDRRIELEELTRQLNVNVAEQTAELRKAQRLLTDIMAQTENAIFVKDTQSRYIFASQKLCKMMNLNAGQILGKMDYDLYPLNKADEFVTTDRRILSTGVPQTSEEEVFENGQTHIYLANKFPLRDESNKMYAICGIAIDISEQRRQAEELRQATRELTRAKDQAEEANRSKTQFLANMSHEIRTPLGAMLGFAQLMLESETLDQSQNQNLKTIVRNGEQLHRIIDELLDISKIEANRFETDKSEFDLEEVIRDVTSLLSGKAEQKGLKFEVSTQGALPERISTDPTRFRQIMMNLINNAIKFTDAGRIDVRFRFLADASPDAKNLLEIDVDDTGVGIPEDKRSKLFQPFSQADDAMTRRYGGTGLGLYLSKRFAQELGGDVSLVRCEATKGCLFRATVDCGPLHSIPSLKFHVASGEHRIKGELINARTEKLDQIKVLIIDDCEDNLELAGHFVSMAGAEVTSLLGPEAAQGVVMQDKFDVVLMDIQMPGLDGYELVRRIRQAGYKKPVVALTAHAMKGERERCFAAGFDGYLNKPIDRALLIREIKYQSQSIKTK